MTFSLHVCHDHRRIAVAHHGPYSLELGHAAAAEILDHVAATGYRQLLADFRSLSDAPAWSYPQLYELTSAVAAVLRDYVVIAAVYQPCQPFARSVRFVESAAEREGLLLRGFHTEDDAAIWLSAIDRTLRR